MLVEFSKGQVEGPPVPKLETRLQEPEQKEDSELESQLDRDRMVELFEETFRDMAIQSYRR
jgi:hypothetical protein